MQDQGQRGPRPRRVLYVENGIGYGGAVICLRHLVRNLDRARFEPLVVTGRCGPLYRDIANDASWLCIRDRRIDTAALAKRLRQSLLGRTPVLGWLMNQVIARLDDLVNFLPFFLGLLWTAARFRPDLIHANNEPLCNRAALLVARILRVPSLQHMRGNIEGSRMMRWAYRLPDHFVTVSRWVSDLLATLDIPADRRTVVYDGIEFDQLDPGTDGRPFRDRFGIAPEEFAVGLVGLLIPWKGQELFLEAARRLAADHPEIRFLIVGGTPDECVPYEQRLRARAAELGLQDRVVFTGHLGNMAGVYCGLNVVVSASTSPEPLGTMVIESLVMGRPLIVPNHGGGAEMVDDGITGLVFRTGDAQSLAKSINRLHAYPALRESLGTAARTKALATFSVERHVEQLQLLYEDLLRKHGAPTPAPSGARG